jgi:hypothetical protein
MDITQWSSNVSTWSISSHSHDLPGWSSMALARATLQTGCEASDAAAGRRRRIWDLASTLHCSIVGTCLSTADLRQFLGKLNDPDARTASEHALHGRAVLAGSRNDVAGKLLNKMLDRRHEAHIKRFAKAATVEEVRRLWCEALERGDIPGAYWATLTHPATDRELVQEAFGEVHMLSHLVGRTNRADIARLRQLEIDLCERDQKLGRQQTRLMQAAQERGDLLRRIDELQAELSRRDAVKPMEPATDAAMLGRRLADEQARAALVVERAEENARALAASRERIAALEGRLTTLEAEARGLEAALAGLCEHGAAAPDVPDLDDLTLLFVGGRPKLIDQLRGLTARAGGELLSHDGGIEDNPSLLPGLVSRCDVALFPVDCISHLGAEAVKRLCRHTGKPFVALRSASVASFVASLASLKRPA